MSTDEIEESARPKLAVDVWDTQYFPERQSFAAFRDGLCGAFMPWSIELPESDRQFLARLETISFAEGSVGRARMNPVTAYRTAVNLADSEADCVYGNFVLSGELEIEQRGRVQTARQGDLVLYDSSELTVLKERHDVQYEDVPLRILKSAFKTIDNPSDYFSNVLLPQSALMRPLATCLSHIGNNMLALSKEEIAGLFEASIALLPVAVANLTADEKAKSALPNANYLLREILDYVRHHISDMQLSPQTVAASFNVSVRYVHKLFATNGTTFNAYVTSRRLDHIRTDLLSPTCYKQPISSLAYRWGFNDLSTFNRIFKSRFGVTPSQFRQMMPPPRSRFRD